MSIALQSQDPLPALSRNDGRGNTATSAVTTRGVAGLAIVMVLCAIAGRAVFLTQPVNSDTAMFVYMGKVVTDGGKIGTDLIDNKLPSVGLLMSVPYKLFGANWTAYTWLGLGMIIATCALLARAAGRCLGAQAIIPVGVASAIWLNLPPVVYGLLQLETIQVFFVAIAACAGLELLTRRDGRDAIVAGLCIGVGMWAKPTAAAILPALVLAIIIGTDWNWRARVRAILLLCAGVTVPTIVCWWLLIITGMADSLPATIAQLRDYSANSTADWIDAFKPICVLAVLMFPAIVMGFVFRRDRVQPCAVGAEGRLNRDLLTRSLARRSRKVTPLPDLILGGTAIKTFIIIWLIMETAGVVAQRRMYAYHFLVLGPPAAMLLGLFARRLRMISLGFALGPAAAMCVLWSVEMLSWPDRQARMTAVITYLNDKAHAGEKVWMDDYPRLMVESDLRPGSRVPLTFLFGNSDEAPLRFGKLIIEDLDQRRPEWIVLHHDVNRYVDFYHQHMVEIAQFPKRGENFSKAWREIDAFARSRYTVVERIENVDILRRSDSASADIHER